MAVAGRAVELYEEPGTRTSARIGMWSSVVSIIFLALAVRFAHHWNPVSLAIVSTWAASLLVGLASSGRAAARATRSRRTARWGLVLCSLSLLALAIAGIAFAAGGDPAGACGGG